MEKWTKRVLSLVLTLLLLCGVVSAGMIQAGAAASWPTDWWKWSQGRSEDASLKAVGCLIVAQAKMLRNSGVVSDASWTPDTYCTWLKSSKKDGTVRLPSSYSMNFVVDNPVDFPSQSGKKLEHVITKSSPTNAWVLEQVKNGYYIFVKVNGGGHWTYVDNNYSIEKNSTYFNDSRSSSVNAVEHVPWNTSIFTSINTAYVYRIKGATSAPTLTGLTAKNITSVSARLEATLSPSISMSEHGVYIGKRSDTTLTQIKGAQNGTITYSGSLFFEIGTKYYKELSPGTEYQYYFYVVSGGKTYKSETKYFTTSGATTYRVDLCSNFSGKNYVAYSDFSSLNTSYYYSRDTSVYTISADSANANGGYNSLKIVGSAAGTTSKSLAIVTHTNHCKADGGIGDNKNMTLSFYAKASVSGTKLYWRWGNSPTTNAANVTLTTSWQKYTIALNKTDAYGINLHPYFDRAGTVYINQLQLEDGASATAFVSEKSTFFGNVFALQGGKYDALPDDVTRDGYDFAGWYTAKTGGTQITAATNVAVGHRRVYAHWTAIPSYTLTYNANGGTGAPGSQTGKRGESISLSNTVPHKDGYVFYGWTTNAQQIDDDVLVWTAGSEFLLEGNITLYAVWGEIPTIQPSSILYMDVPATAYVDNDASGDWWYFTPEETGTYRFCSDAGVQTSCQLEDSNGNFIDGDFDSDGDFNLIVYLIGGETYTLIVGFRYGTGLSGSIPIMVTAYEGPPIFTQTISYHANGGSDVPEPETFTGESGILSMLQPQRFGYSFIGWSRFQDTTNPYVILYPGQSVVDDTNSDALYYAMWKPAETLTAGTAVTATIQFGYQQLWYKFTPATSGRYEFYSGSASGTDPMATLYSSAGKELLHGDDELGFPNFSIPADLIVGTTYYLETHSYGSDTGSYSVAVKSAAPYVPKVFTLTYDANGGTNPPPAETRDEYAVFSLNTVVPTRASHTFLGWAASRYETNPEVWLAPGTAGMLLEYDMTLYAIWERNEEATTYALTVASGSGSGSYAAGTGVTIIANAPPSGKVFDRWTATAGGFADANSASTTFTMPAGVATVTATYKDAPTPPTPKKFIFSTKYEATFLNWILFFLCFGFIWMWF